jgi:hypothetical protein
MSTALRRLAAQPAMLFLLAASISVVIYLAASAAGSSLGFPLDDAWIHQTYARNLGLRGEFSFEPGQPSAGSTSPLWTGLLAIGYLARINPLVWTYVLGTLLLVLNAWLTYRLVLRWWPGASVAALAGGLLVTLEWHLAWSAGSGMETLLFSACALAIFVFDWPSQAGWAGLVAGLAVLTRPDGLSLLPVLAARACLSSQRSWRSVLYASAGFGVLFIPYLAFNVALSGSPWPNTFYAKQAEYAILRDQPLLARLATVGALPFVGVLVVLLPTIWVAVWQAARGRRWEAPIALGWVLALMGAYALRLPVTYQHGRYLMPVIPVLLALGVGGLAAVARPRSTQLIARVVSRVWLAAVAILALIFWLRGASAYRTDVQIIQTEMVATARWVAANTPPTALIAAHDIGALGYFGGRPVLDMAGLVSPQVIPFIRDESQLSAWLDQKGAGYLVTFPGWYPILSASRQAQRVFVTNAPYSRGQGGENMAVYIWRPKP